jgi:peptidyl-prolyl cis-trans isomerase C
MKAALLIFLFLGACTFSDSVSKKSVIEINDKSMTAKEFSDKLANRLKKYDALVAKDPNTLARTKEDILREFVMAAISENYAKSQNISVSDEELEKEINSVRSNYPDDLSFRRVLSEEGKSFVDWKKELKQTLLQRKVFATLNSKVLPPTPEEIRKTYEENKERFKRKERIYLRQIVLDELSKAQAVKEESRKKDFSELAKKFSVAPEGKAGGLVGWVEKGSVDIFDKAFNLPIGGISQVLESTYGFHIFKVERRAPQGYASIEEVKDILVQEIQGRKEQGEFANWLDKQIRATRVLRNNDLIKSIVVETHL